MKALITNLISRLKSVSTVFKTWIVAAVAATIYAVKELENLPKALSLFKPFKDNLVENWEKTKSLQFAVVALIVLNAIAIAIAILYGISYHRRRKDEIDAEGKQKQQVLFLPPSLEGFYGEYLTALVRAARKHGGAEVEIAIVPYVHSESDFCPEQRLEDTIRYMDHRGTFIRGVFIIPKDPMGNQDSLKSFNKCPIVTLDVYPGVEEDPEYPHFVGGDEEKGGRCAAVKAKEVLQRVREHLPGGAKLTVLVLTGSDTPWESQRVQSFEDEVRQWATSANADLSIIRSRPLAYDYDQAVEYISNWQAEKDANEMSLSNPLETHLIFACSDTMALGAAKALQGLRRQNSSQACPKIIGYDGTVGMRRLLESGHDLLTATVDVRLEAQAEKAVEVMMRLLRANDRAERVRPNPPRECRMFKVSTRSFPS